MKIFKIIITLMLIAYCLFM